MASFWDDFWVTRGVQLDINEEKIPEDRWVWYSSEKHYLGFWVLLVPICIMLYNGYEERKKQYAYTERNIQGTIISVEVGNKNNKARQYHILKIRDEISKTILEYNSFRKTCHTDTLLFVQVGDSVSKPSNSRTKTFFKLKNGIFEKFCECDY